MNPTRAAIYDSPLGPLRLVAGAEGLRALQFSRPSPTILASCVQSHDSADPRPPRSLHAGLRQLGEYFAGQRREFELELELTGTPFQRAVWGALAQIPYGATTTYGAVARQLGTELPGVRPEPRAVAAAIARTPVPIVIPCHRVLSADGALTGYLGGLRRKRALLDFEAADGARCALEASWAQRQLALL